MKKLIIIMVIGLGAIAFFYFIEGPFGQVQDKTELDAKSPAGYKDISYNIEGQAIQLKGGLSENEADPGSVEKITTEYFGNEARGDFNNDGTQDVVFILTQSGGGTGVFFYVVTALNTADGYKGTNAVFLGDRIAPQTTEFKNGQIIVNYADRKEGEPFSEDPSVGVSKYLKISQGKLVEISK